MVPVAGAPAAGASAAGSPAAGSPAAGSPAAGPDSVAQTDGQSGDAGEGGEGTAGKKEDSSWNPFSDIKFNKVSARPGKKPYERRRESLDEKD